jgi:hypothetical protein
VSGPNHLQTDTTAISVVPYPLIGGYAAAEFRVTK